jgi:hypothetical protein
MRDKAYEKRLPAIREARRLVLEECALFPMLSHLIPGLHQSAKKPLAQETIQSRHAWRRNHPISAMAYGLERFLISSRANRQRKSFVNGD